MIIRRIIASLLLLVVILLVYGACKRKESASTMRTSAGEPQTPGTLAVHIITMNPTVQTDLQAVCDNCPANTTVRFRWERNGQLIPGEEGATLVARSLFSYGDSIQVTVTANGRTGTASAVIGKSPPVVSAVTFKPDIIHRGVDISAVPQGRDADGEPVQFSYRWIVNDTEYPDDSPMLSGSRFRKGDRISVIVTPFGTGGSGKPLTTRPILIPNAPPRITSLPPADFRGAVYEYQVVAEDPDDDPVMYSLLSGPQGMAVNSAGLVSVPVTKDIIGTHQVEIEVQDTHGAKNGQAYTLNLTIP